MRVENTTSAIITSSIQNYMRAEFIAFLSIGCTTRHEQVYCLSNHTGHFAFCVDLKASIDKASGCLLTKASVLVSGCHGN